MIPLGSCTMKLNAAAEMLPVTWEKVAGIHPFVPVHQARGYQELFAQLERWLAEITGFAAVSLQPNAGSQGEYAGLLAIREYHHSRGQARARYLPHSRPPRMAQIPRAPRWRECRLLPIACDSSGNIDRVDLDQKNRRASGKCLPL